MPDKLMTPGEVADTLSVPLARVYELARTGALPKVAIGRHVRFKPADIAKFIDEGGLIFPGGWRRESATKPE